MVSTPRDSYVLRILFFLVTDDYDRKGQMFPLLKGYEFGVRSGTLSIGILLLEQMT